MNRIVQHPLDLQFPELAFLRHGDRSLRRVRPDRPGGRPTLLAPVVWEQGLQRYRGAVPLGIGSLFWHHPRSAFGRRLGEFLVGGRRRHRGGQRHRRALSHRR
mgnify:CR=1 FL=1